MKQHVANSFTSFHLALGRVLLTVGPLDTMSDTHTTGSHFSICNKLVDTLKHGSPKQYSEAREAVETSEALSTAQYTPSQP